MPGLRRLSRDGATLRAKNVIPNCRCYRIPLRLKNSLKPSRG
jgi:hypothetical protein